MNSIASIASQFDLFDWMIVAFYTFWLFKLVAGDDGVVETRDKLDRHEHCCGCGKASTHLQTLHNYIADSSNLVPGRYCSECVRKACIRKGLR
jgi:hypothetical protein